ncbi:L-histidine N(alpha)-methyltransferase [Rubrivirga sp. IMCC45206]|uniref:L-histidine N(alpha)-methyltransferase n=1 Tax=Rubrivirga sp. IMCC45206 TaxID=3391614 RepID=UPI00398FD17A
MTDPDTDAPPAHADAFAADVLAGLASRPRTLPAKYFYDEAGSRLFDEITRLDAYYPTRTERAILTEHADAIVDAIGRNSALVEYGSGSSDKTRILLDALHARRTLAAYVPIDISETFLLETADRLRRQYDGLPVLPVAADYTEPYTLPDLPDETRRLVVFFPGSTIGNFSRPEARVFLQHVAQVIGEDGALLVGVDQWKDEATLRLAYDDPEGVTAAFNLNVLRRINRELDGDADLSAWAHEARINPDERRVEMHLRSLREQTLTVLGHPFAFDEGETIHTEDSHKYGPDGLADLASDAGLARRQRWTDADGRFAVELYERGAGR